MIYLDNSTSGQTIYIPRNDLGFIPQKPTDLEGKKVTIDRDLTYVYPSSGFIGMSSVTINAEAYAQRNYDDGFDDGFLDGMSSGYTEGETHQKSLLVSTAFTENGEYSKEDGWSAVTVNVPTGSTVVLEEKTVVISADTTNVLPSSGYDGMSAVTIDASDYAQQNYEGGYTSGHSQGMADQKALLSTTALTENGEYSRENGWSGVTVNIDTASTWNSGYNSGHTDGVSEEKAKMSAVTFTANTAVTLSDGSYSAVTVDVPQTGYTQQDLDNAFASGETVGENTIIATFSSTTATTNGQYGSTAHPLSSITVNVPQTGVSIPLSSITINSNTAITVNDVAYTGITVNVPLVYFDDYIHNMTMQSDPPFTYHIDTNIIPTTGTTMRVRGMSKGYDNGNTIIGHTEGLPYPHFRGFWTNGNIYFDNAYSSGRIQATWSGNTDGNPIDITFANFSIYDNITETMLATGSTYYGMPSNETLKVDVGSWWVKQIEIWDGETKVYDGVAAHNSNGEIGLYDYVSQKMYTNSNIDIVYENLTPVIEPNKSFTATSNGDYTIMPTTATIVNQTLDDSNNYIISIEFSGYPQTGRYDVLNIKDFSGVIDGYVNVYYNNGIPYSQNVGWSGGTVYVEVRTSTLLRLRIPNANANFSWEKNNGFLENYDAMSAVTLTVNVPQFIGNVKYVEYIETDGTSIGWDTGLKVGSENSSFNVELDVMPLSGNPTSDGFYTFMSDVNSSEQQNVLARTFGGGYHIDDCQFLLGNRNVRSGLSFSQRYDMVYNYASQSGNIEVNNVEFLQEQGISLQSINTVRTIFINGYRNKSSETDFQRSPIARYYKVKITIDGVEHTFNPCLDSNDVPCFFDEYNREYIYHIGTGNTPTAGPVLPSPDYVSGYTDGFASGSSQGFIGGIESALFGAYYPIDSATNKSYCTHFPDLEKGKSIYFDIISTSSRVANKMFGGDYMNRDEHYLMIGYDNSNNEIDIQINAKGTPSGITTNAYLTLFNPTSGSIIYNQNQRICGEIAVTDTECNYGVACLGFVPNKYTVQGDFTGSYPIKFNQDCASAFTLCKVVYRDIATGAFEHYFSYDSSTNEIKDWITGDIAPTYDYNGNRVYGVLETKEL